MSVQTSHPDRTGIRRTHRFAEEEKGREEKGLGRISLLEEEGKIDIHAARLIGQMCNTCRCLMSLQVEKQQVVEALPSWLSDIGRGNKGQFLY